MNEITLNELIDSMEQDSKKFNSVRNFTKHLSELSICGLKYRDKLDNNRMIPFNINYYFGNAFEFLLVNQLKKLFGSDVETQKVVKYKFEDIEFEGHCDVYINSSNVIYEIKTSFSFNGDYTDIYLRQLKAYLIANHSTKGYLWIFYPAKKKFKEIIVDEITLDDRNNFYNNLIAFRDNKYVEGIENSLCGFCEAMCEYRLGLK